MKKRLLLYLLFFCLTQSMQGFGQLSEGGRPLSLSPGGTSQNLINQQLGNVQVFKSPNTDSLLNIANRDVGGPYLFATDQVLNLDIKSKKYIPVEGGGKLWIWRLSFSKALSLNAYFSTFNLGRGAKLFVYSPDGTQILGSFSAVNNQSHGKLSTGLIRGGEMVVEYYESAETQQSTLVLGAVAYGFRDPFGKLLSTDPLQVNESSSCNVNVNCNTNSSVQTAKRAVAKILYERSGLWYICSGSLMNNTNLDGKPYFLTAFHCYDGSDVNSYIFYFNYESPDCNNPTSTPSSNTLSGATFKSAWSGSDFALVQINDYPPINYNVFYAGFDATDTTPSSTIGIHHPQGDIKKVSIDNQVPTKSSVTIGSQTSAVWNTRFDSGTTEGGSSGSPLFSNDYRVIAQLYGVGWGYSGGYNPCALQSNTQYYGRLGVSWNGNGSASNRLKDWLSPNQNTTALNGTDCPDNSPLCSYCSVSLYTLNCTDSDGLNALSVNNTVLTSNSGCSPDGYHYYGSEVPTLNLGKGTTNPFTAQLLSTNYNEMVAIWIDFNKDKKYTADEKVFQTTAPVTGTFTGNIAIPCTTAVGTTRMRVRVFYTNSTQNVEPCDLYSYGEVEEYDVNIGNFPTPVVSANPTGTVCSGSNVTLTATNCFGTVSWGSAGSGASITVTPTANTTYTATCSSNGCSSSASINVSVNPGSVPVITANNTQLCAGQTITFTATGTPVETPLQWLRNGEYISGATGTTYATGTAGGYSVVTTTSLGTANTWTAQSASTTQGLNGVYFISAQTGWAVGNTGTILKTSTMGSTWTTQTSGVIANLKSVYFADSQTGWAVGNAGTILKTADGGTTWALQTSGTTANLSGIHLMSTQTGWIVGGNGTILNTTDGGVTWISQTSATTENLNSLYFVNAQTGWIVGGSGTVLKTTNGGGTWAPQSWSAQSGYGTNLTSVHFINEQLGLAVAGFGGFYGGTIIRTTDGGSNWTVSNAIDNYGLESVRFSDEQTAWVVGTSGRILKSVNGGSWTEQNSLNGMGPWIKAIYFANAQNGWVVGGGIGNGANDAILKYGIFHSPLCSSNTIVIDPTPSINVNTSQLCEGQSVTFTATGVPAGTPLQWQRNGINIQGAIGTTYTTSTAGNYTVAAVRDNGVWVAQTSGTTQHLRGFYTTDSQNSWAVGENGTILRTTNGGATWTVQTSGVTAHLYAVHFADAQTGWVAGQNGTIRKTVDGGVSWSAQTSETTASLRSIYFMNAQTGWVVGDNGTILKTVDGGTTWTTQYSNSPGHSLNAVHFSNFYDGWAIGTSTAGGLRTTNSGSSWSNLGYSYAQDVYFADYQTGWIIGTDHLYRTTNGGSNWISQDGPWAFDDAFVSKRIHFINTQRGWIVGGMNTIYQTTDGGTVWSGQPTSASLRDVMFADVQNGWAVGENGAILKYTATACTSNAITINPTPVITASSTQLCEGEPVTFTATGVPAGTPLQWQRNGVNIQGATGTAYTTSLAGNYTVAAVQSVGTWNPQTSGTTQNLRGFYATDFQNGWAVGDNGTILRTSDGGTVWSAQTSGVTTHLNAVRFADAQTGWVVGQAGTIRKTTDGGSSWNAQASGTTADLKSIYFINAQTGWVAGTAGTILKTTNGGTTWTLQTFGVSDFESIHFSDALNGRAVGRTNGSNLKTTDGGTTWTAFGSVFNVYYPTDVYFINAQTGWIAGGGISKTVDGGTNWSTQVSPSGAQYELATKYMYFLDSQRGWAVGSTNTIFQTVNGGTNWTTQPVNVSLRDVMFTDVQNGWAVGSTGTILKYTASVCNSNTITIYPTPVITTNSPQLCEGQEVTLTASNVSAGIPLQWQRNGVNIQGATGTTYTTSIAGNYTLAAVRTIGAWTAQTSGTAQHLRGVYAIGSQNGWAVGNNGTILRTTNGGTTWSAQNSGTTATFNAVFFADIQTGWAVGQGGMIRKTTDGGINWNAQTSGVMDELKGIHFVDSQTGWIVGAGGVILKTTNGGTDWILQNSGSSAYNLSAVQFLDAQNGWAVGISGGTSSASLQTTNGGNTWTPFGGPYASLFSDLYLTGPQGVWAVGYSGIYQYNTESGWTSAPTIYPGYEEYRGLKHVYFTDSQRGWVVGMGNVGNTETASSNITQTADGGANWVTQPSGANQPLLDIIFGDAQTGWTVGENGTILKYTAAACTSNSIAILSCTPLTITPAKVFVCPNTPTTLTVSGCTGTVTWTGGSTGNSLIVSPAVTSTYSATCSLGGSASITVNVAATTALLTDSDNITTGTQLFQTTQTITATNSIGSTAINPKPGVTYQAGQAIVLQPGFNTVNGSTFKAEIRSCN